MKKLTGLFAVGSALLIGGIAQAQPAVTTVPPATTVTTETTTSTDTGAATYDVPGTMATTGGAPIAMAMAGILAAGGAFFARRKLA